MPNGLSRSVTRLRGRLYRGLDEEEGYGREAERRARAGLEAFDPRAAFQEYAGGAQRMFMDELGRELTTLRGQSVGAGRLETGFWDLDQGDVIRNVSGDFQNRIASGALQTAGMEQQRRGDLLASGTEARNRYFDLLAGTYDRATDAYRWNKQNRKKGLGAFLGGTLGTAIGAFGGPTLAAAGGNVGAKLFK
jgi:hypothetical protein